MNKKSGRKKIPRNVLIEKLKELSNTFGRTPKYLEMKHLKNFPSVTAYDNCFGNWTNACKAAGLIPRPKGFQKGHKPHNFKGIKKSSTSKLRFEILSRDNFTCRYCGRTPQDGARLEIDHITPSSKGGKTRKSNLTTSCSECNNGKSDILLNNSVLSINKKEE